MQTLWVDVFKIYMNLSTRCHSLSLDVRPICLHISVPRGLCRGYPQITTEHCNEMWSGTSAVHVLFIWRKQFYISDLLNTFSLLTFLKMILIAFVHWKVISLLKTLVLQQVLWTSYPIYKKNLQNFNSKQKLNKWKGTSEKAYFKYQTEH